MRKHNYVVGYKGEEQCVYGSNLWVELMTLKEARKRAKGLITTIDNKVWKGVVYKLVEVKPGSET